MLARTGGCVERHCLGGTGVTGQQQRFALDAEPVGGIAQVPQFKCVTSPVIYRKAVTRTISEAAWRMKPSWYLVATDDRMIPPPAQRAMAGRTGGIVTEVAGSHSIYLSQPKAVASLIDRAAG